MPDIFLMLWIDCWISLFPWLHTSCEKYSNQGNNQKQLVKHSTQSCYLAIFRTSHTSSQAKTNSKFPNQKLQMVKQIKFLINFFSCFHYVYAHSLNCWTPWEAALIYLDALPYSFSFEIFGDNIINLEFNILIFHHSKAMFFLALWKSQGSLSFSSPVILSSSQMVRFILSLHPERNSVRSSIRFVNLQSRAISLTFSYSLKIISII